MTATPPQLDPDSLVARMIAELQANPDAQALLLRALLTSEFLGMPIRLERIEADIAELKAAAVVTNTRLDRLEATMTQFDARLGRVENDVAVLKGDGLEVKLHRRIRPLISQRFNMRRPQMMQSPVQDTSPELFEPVEEAADNGTITDAQETRLNTTDVILRAQRKSDRAQVWVVVEVSNSISRHDIERVRQSAEALMAVFQQEVMAVVAGYRIHPQDQEQADSAGVYTILIEETS